MRRTLIAFFAVALTTIVGKMLFLAVIIGFICIQWKVDPFVVEQANQLEFVLLCCLPFVMLSYTGNAMPC